ncbi:MAG: hypothetical protein MUC49_15800 [Raineya sp.]|jgi:hypothetical protein|nr:hypothetical protein [Raineya sp.]
MLDKTLLELVKGRITVATEDEVKVEEIGIEVIIELEPYLKKNLPFEEYTDLEKLLIADYTAYKFLDFDFSINNSTQEAQGDNPIKITKADVVEVHFDTSRSKDDSLIRLTSRLKASICQKAKTLNISLPLCSSGQSTKSNYRPFITYTP